MSEQTPEEFQAQRRRSLEDKGYQREVIRLYQLAGQQRAREEYAAANPPPLETAPPALNASPGRISSIANHLTRYSGTYRQVASIPRGMPRFLANRTMLLAFWLIAMILVASDEWSLGFKFPRPARLWYASLTYFALFILSQSDFLTPICNALGGGYVVVLLYENTSGNSLSFFGVNLTGSSNSPASSSDNTSTGSGTSTTTQQPATNRPNLSSQLQQQVASNLGANVPAS